MLNKLINRRNNLSVKTTELSCELLETLKTIENCISCKIDGYDLEEFYEWIIDELKNCLSKLGKKEQEEEDIINKLDYELFKADNQLNKVLCESCEEEKIEKLTDKYGNEKMARFLHECKLNANSYCGYYTQWIPFNEFRNIEYLVKDSFGEGYHLNYIFFLLQLPFLHISFHCNNNHI